MDDAIQDGISTIRLSCRCDWRGSDAGSRQHMRWQSDLAPKETNFKLYSAPDARIQPDARGDINKSTDEGEGP